MRAVLVATVNNWRRIVNTVKFAGQRDDRSRRWVQTGVVVAVWAWSALAGAETGVTNIVNGVTTNATGPYYVGDTGPLNAQIVTNAGVLNVTGGDARLECGRGLSAPTGNNVICKDSRGAGPSHIHVCRQAVERTASPLLSTHGRMGDIRAARSRSQSGLGFSPSRLGGKLQTPTSKLQRNSKLEISNRGSILRV
jgi:hypothetical protein